LRSRAKAKSHPSLDDFGSTQSKIIVIDSNSLERDFCEKEVTTFSHPALVHDDFGDEQ